MSNDTQPGFLYAVSWEVCNPGGGVYTTLSTSAPSMRHYYGDDMLYVGPDLWAQRPQQSVFIEDATQPRIAALAAERDVPVRFGRWDIDGSPPVALVDFGRLLEGKNRVLGDLWNDYGVDSIHADWDTIERILFGYAAGLFVELHYHGTVRPRARRAVAHFHQWLAAGGVLRLTKSTPEIATVYTPHGTALGRGLAAEGFSVHARMAEIEPASWAKDRGIEAQHTVEVAAARAATILTVVSDQGLPEAELLLGRLPERVTPNGYTPQHGPALAPPAEVRTAILRAAERFLGAPIDVDRTRIGFSSGRYEFHNKGLDAIIAALGRLRAREPRPERDLLMLMFVAAHKTGARAETLKRLKSAELAGEPCGVCTHNLARPDEDEICKAAAEAGLRNAPGDPVKLIFVPLILDGTDPMFPFTYTDCLQASDLTVFPSIYEPWGFTPVESLAAGVPTITTDVTGFGRFVGTLPAEERAAVAVMPVSTQGEESLAHSLESEFERFLGRTDDELAELRRAAATAVKRTGWDKLAGLWVNAYQQALESAMPRQAGVLSPALTGLSRRSLVGIAALSEDRPRLHSFTVAAALPKRLARLEHLAHNLWWCWNRSARELFEAIDAEGFEAAGRNPVRFLREGDPRKFDAAARDKEILRQFDAVLEDFDAYRAADSADIPATAYFCAEFATHESLPVYSGGLGVLAGDHLKSASDLHVPLTAIGLRYAHGYFVQRIQPDGTQGVEFVRTDLNNTPLTEVTDAEGNPLRLSIRVPERQLHAGVYRADVGRVPLFLLDTAVPENDAAERVVTDRLYPSDREPRLRQEILLGIGGWRLLKKLNRLPEVCHLNEGHSAFLLLERLLDLVEEEGLTYAEACNVVRGSTVFTTHTPVPAGHDRFSEGLMRRYFGHVSDRLGLSWDEFLDLGREAPDAQDFSMTVLALKLSGHANGVSRLHGDVSRDMLSSVWPGFHKAETPVDSVTNGVHLATWVGPAFDRLFQRHLGPAWSREALAENTWHELKEVADAEIWQAHVAQKVAMVHFLRDTVEEVGSRRGESPAHLRARIDAMNEDALWIGYARRFAPYKRATLLFQDALRLEAILASTDKPVRVVFAGKSHPDDREGAQLVQEIVKLTTDDRFAGRVYFVEDYGMAVARMLVQGVDIWLNTPTRPLEASGTSGMKACLNGGLHVSILDGWWCEGYDGTNGYAFGEGREFANAEMQREYDSRSLYALLESRILPLFFDRDEDGVPVGWVERMKQTLATIPPQFNTHRMLRDYARTAYRPLGRSHEKLREDNYATVRRITAHHQRLREAWPEVHIEDVSVSDASRGSLAVGDVFEVRARVRLGPLNPDDISVELYVGADQQGELVEPVVIPLLMNGDTSNGSAEYVAAYMPSGAGTFQYGVRVLPMLESFNDAAQLGLVRWA